MKRLIDINSIIRALNKAEKKVIICVYVRGMSIMDTADQLKYYDSHMSKIHMAALRKIGEKLKFYEKRMDNAA